MSKFDNLAYWLIFARVAYTYVGLKTIQVFYWHLHVIQIPLFHKPIKEVNFKELQSIVEKRVELTPRSSPLQRTITQFPRLNYFDIQA